MPVLLSSWPKVTWPAASGSCCQSQSCSCLTLSLLWRTAPSPPSSDTLLCPPCPQDGALALHCISDLSLPFCSLSYKTNQITSLYRSHQRSPVLKSRLCLRLLTSHIHTLPPQASKPPSMFCIVRLSATQTESQLVPELSQLLCRSHSTSGTLCSTYIASFISRVSFTKEGGLPMGTKHKAMHPVDSWIS